MPAAPKPPPSSPSPLIVLGVALVAGFVLRVEYFRELILSPFAGTVLLDAEWYHLMAQRLLEGRPLAEGRAYFRPPGYPMFIAAIYSVFDAKIDAVRITQWLLGLVQVFFAWDIARRTHGERAGSVAAFLAATYGMFIYFEGEMLTTALGTFFAFLVVWLLLRSDGERPLAWIAGAGLALGVAATLHATLLAIAPAAFFWVLFREGPKRAGWSAAILLTVATSVPVGAVAWRNWNEGREFVLLGAQGGINFYVGNNENSDGKSALAPGFADAGQALRPGEYRDTIEVAAETLASRALGRLAKPGEVSRYWFARGSEWMRDHPKAAIAHWFRKTIYFWNGFEISNNRDLRDQAERFTPIMRLFLVQWTVLLPFAVLGLWRGGGDQRRSRLLLGCVALYSFSIIAFFVCARYRQPAVAWMLPFAAAGIVRFVRDAREAGVSLRHFAASAAILFVAFVGTNPRFVSATGLAPVTEERDAPFHQYNLAVLYEQRGDYDRAIAEYQASAATGVRDPRVYLNLGNALARTGRTEEAREAYRETMRIAPDYTTAVRTNLGIMAAQSADWREAIRQFDEVLRVEPAHPGALGGLGAAYLSSGRYDEAIEVTRRALANRVPPEGPLRRNLALAYLGAGLLDEARQEGEAALRAGPQDVSTVIALVRIYTARGEEAAAKAMAERARQLAPGAPAVEQGLREALRDQS